MTSVQSSSRPTTVSGSKYSRASVVFDAHDATSSCCTGSKSRSLSANHRLNQRLRPRLERRHPPVVARFADASHNYGRPRYRTLLIVFDKPARQ
jgi:hypothetical protein